MTRILVCVVSAKNSFDGSQHNVVEYTSYNRVYVSRLEEIMYNAPACMHTYINLELGDRILYIIA